MTLGAVMRVLLLAAMAALAFAAPARADDASEGRRLFQRGEEYLRQGDYRAAAEAFQAGYLMAPRAGFLLNIGNCYRKLGELGKARQYYWRFLDAAPKDHPSRTGVIEYLRAMEQIEADGVAVDSAGVPGVAGTAPPPPPDEPITPVDPPFASEPTPPGALRSAAMLHEVPAAAHTETVPAPVTERPPLWRRWWFWTAAGALAAGAVITAAVIAHPAASPCAASLGCARE
jgi:tetratricopeptide (TPR) repeat protein